MACALATGRLPGSPRHTGQVRVLGGSPNESSQPQNIFVAVDSWMWISSPITASSCSSAAAPAADAAAGAPAALIPAPAAAWACSDTGGRSVEAERVLEGVGGVEQPVLAEHRSGQLQAD